MLITRLGSRRFFAAVMSLAFAAAISSGPTAHAQGNPPITFKVQAANERMEMTVNTSRILRLDQKIPRFVVNNPEMVKVLPLSANELQVAAGKTGVTQINLWTEAGEIYTVDVIIYGDARELQNILSTLFPNSSLVVRPLANSVVISGFVDQPDHVAKIISVAQDYYPKIVNNISVGGVQQVLLHCKVMEVSRTKLRAMGFDFAQVSASGGYIVSSISGLITAAGSTINGVGTNANMQFGIVGGDSFFGFMEAMRKYNLAKIISEPTLVTVSGRPAYFEVGGEIPYLTAQSLGTTTVEWKDYGTRLDFVPIVLGNGAIRLEVRPRVSQIDESISVSQGGFVVPGTRIRELDTGVEMKAGQTLALAGLLEHRVDAENKGVPWVADLPWIGAAFRRVEESVNEIELLVLVTPELVEAMDCNEVPPCGPGMSSVSPNDCDLYWKGHIEVPRCDGICGGAGCGPEGCGPNGGHNNGGHNGGPAGYGPYGQGDPGIPGGLGTEEVAPGRSAPTQPPPGQPMPQPKGVMNNGSRGSSVPVAGGANGGGQGGTVMRMKSSSPVLDAPAQRTNAIPVNRSYAPAASAPISAPANRGDVSASTPTYPPASAVPTPVMARDRYNQNNAPARSVNSVPPAQPTRPVARPATPAPSSSQQPGLIGPMGYDVIE